MSVTRGRRVVGGGMGVCVCVCLCMCVCVCVCVCVCSRREASEICVRQVHSRHRYYHTHKYTQRTLQTLREHRHTQNISHQSLNQTFFGHGPFRARWQHKSASYRKKKIPTL